MRYPCLLFILLATTIFLGTLSAQQTEQPTRPKTQKKQEVFSIYLNKTVILKLNKQEYLQFRDSINTQTKDALRKINDHKIEWFPANEHKNRNTETQPTYYTIYRDNILVTKLGKINYRKFKDSVANKTKDTLFANADNRVDIHSYHTLTSQQKNTVKPSAAVFINTKGYVAIHLPLVKTHRYRIRFFDTDDKLLFEIKTIKETDLVLDKTNFIHAGWFSFELYEDEVLKEKNKFFLQKEQ